MPDSDSSKTNRSECDVRICNGLVVSFVRICKYRDWPK